MTDARWQFSLRSLFIAMTLFAAFIAFAANYPVIAFVCVVFTMPFFSAQTIEYLVIHRPTLARVIMVAYGTAFLGAACYIGILAYRAHELNEWIMWVALLMLSGFGFGCYFAAWHVSFEEHQPFDPAKDETF